MSSKKVVVYYGIMYHCPSLGLGHKAHQCGLMWGESKKAVDRLVMDELLEQWPDAINICMVSQELPQDKLILLTGYLNQAEGNLPETNTKKSIVA